MNKLFYKLTKYSIKFLIQTIYYVYSYKATIIILQHNIQFKRRADIVTLTMKPEQRLITQVQQFLSSKHNIKIQIPRLSNLINSKINLKIWPTPQIQIPIRSPSSHQYHNASPLHQHQQPQLHQNRYKQLISYIESLLQSSNLDVEAIDNFMTVFNKVINTDIDIMQKNQSIRSNSYKIKEKVLFRIQDITKKTDSLNANISKIHDKSDILSFIAIDIKNYLLSMKLIQEQYESVRAVEVHTSLKIDDIYTYQHSSQQDYHDHYEPLLQVLVRLRANMLNLQSSVKKCDRIQMPLKSVNLLANCKNLLTELKPFLIDDRCSFNRLIFFVVSQQSQNMKAISGFYKNYLQYVKSLVYNVLKCVFLGHLFKSYYHQFNTTLQQQRKKIVQTIITLSASSNTSNIKIDPFSQTKQSLNLSQQRIQKLSSNIMDVEQVICYGQTTIMQDYLQEKICKKLNYLIGFQKQIQDIKNLLSKTQNIFDIVQSIQQENISLTKVQEQVKKYIQFLNKDEGSAQAGSEGNKSMSKSMLNNFQESPDENNKKIKVFQSAFLLIQQNNLSLSKLHQKISQSSNSCKQVQLTSAFFPSLQDKITKIRGQYLQMQTNLLNCYKDVLENQEAQQEQGVHYSKKVIDDVGNYLAEQPGSGQAVQGSFFAQMGGQILNEDEQCHQVKELLGLIDKAQYKIRKARGNKINEPSSSQKQAKQKPANQLLILQQNKQKLQKYRQYLQWLLLMFEGSMDQNILQSIIDKIDFNQQNEANIKKSISKVQQLLSEIDKYEKQLKRIIKQIQREKDKVLSQAEQKRDIENTVICNKILKVARQRLVLYELINTIYSECLEIYLSLKQQKPGQPALASNIQQTGLTLFSKPQFLSILSLYHSLNKVSVLTKLLHDSAIPSKTCNYINDQLLDPYSSRLQAYAKLNQNQMLNLVIRLEKAMHIQKEYKNIIGKWDQSMETMAKDGKWDLNIMKQQSQELNSMGEQIQKIIQLDKKELVVHNLQQMKRIQKQCQEHFDLVNQIIVTQHLSQLSIIKQYTNPKLKQITSQLNKINTKKQVNQQK